MAKRPSQLSLVPGDPRGRPVRRVRKGFDATIAALRDQGRIETVDDALVALGRTLADCVDDEHAEFEPKRFTVGRLAAILHPIVNDLRGDKAPVNDEFDRELEAMRERFAEMGDTTPT